MLEEPHYARSSGRTKAIDDLQDALSETLSKKPDSWDVYSALQRSFEGTIREMAAAVSGL